MKDKERLEWPFIKTLNSILKPAGYRRAGFYWRKDCPEAHVVVQLENILGANIFEIRLGCWLKALGHIEPRDLQPVICASHICMTAGDPRLGHLHFKLRRALSFANDYLESAAELYLDYLDIINDLINENEPLTFNYRVRVLTEVLNCQVLPLLEQQETADGIKAMLADAHLHKAVDKRLFKHLNIDVPDAVETVAY